MYDYVKENEWCMYTGEWNLHSNSKVLSIQDSIRRVEDTNSSPLNSQLHEPPVQHKIEPHSIDGGNASSAMLTALQNGNEVLAAHKLELGKTHAWSAEDAGGKNRRPRLEVRMFPSLAQD